MYMSLFTAFDRLCIYGTDPVFTAPVFDLYQLSIGTMNRRGRGQLVRTQICASVLTILARALLTTTSMERLSVFVDFPVILTIFRRPRCKKQTWLFV